jgi:hypothetical protein
MGLKECGSSQKWTIAVGADQLSAPSCRPGRYVELRRERTGLRNIVRRATTAPWFFQMSKAMVAEIQEIVVILAIARPILRE